MSETKTRDGIRPFCPVHHWRMAFESKDAKTGLSYRCNYSQCNIRFGDSRGYFEGTKDFGHAALQERIEAISCKNNEQHYPCIVGYAKESDGSLTEEWRHWKCSVEQCDFSTRQKISPPVRTPLPVREPIARRDHLLSRR